MINLIVLVFCNFLFFLKIEMDCDWYACSVLKNKRLIHALEMEKNERASLVSKLILNFRIFYLKQRFHLCLK